MATNIMAMTDMAATTETYKWLVTVSAPHGKSTYDPAAYGEKIVRLISEKLNVQHIASIAPSSVERMFVVEATNKAATIMQTQSWIDSVRPHGNQYGTYIIPVVEAMDRDKRFARVRKLQALILESMLENDILKLTLKGGHLYVVCTVRGKNFLANMAFLGKAEKI